RQRLAGFDVLAAHFQREQLFERTALAVDQRKQFDARDHLAFLGQEASACHLVRGHAGLRSDIAGAEVLLQRPPDRFPNFRVIDHARPSSAAFTFSSCALYSASLPRMDSITCAGARLRNASSPSCRSELAMFFSSCSF